VSRTGGLRRVRRPELAGGWHDRRVRMTVVVAAVVGGVLAAGCMGGNIFGANPGDGGCGFRPDGLIVDDITGVWEGDGHRFTLRLDGTVTGPATLVAPSPDPSAAGRPPRPVPGSARASSASGRPGVGRPPPVTAVTTVEGTGRWALKAETSLGDIDITDVTSPRGPATFGLGGLYVSGSRRQPWLYTLGDGDPDSCDITKYERTSRG